MKAIQATRYGPPEVLQLVDTEKPTPGEDQVLIKVFAASVNPADWHGMKGGLTRVFGGGFFRPKDPKVGTDLAGRVETVGSRVTRLRPGDEVFGTCSGSLAEYAVAREVRLVQKPTNLSFEEAAAVPIAGITALQGLRDKGHLHAGQKVLINGASGGVGTFAVQIAKAYGAEVTGVCSPGNVEVARSLGADRVIDYTKEDFTRNGQTYDLIYDIASHHSISAYKRILNPNGICSIAGIGFPHLSVPHFFGLLIAGRIRSKFGDKKVGFMGMARITSEDLAVLAELLAARKIVPVIDRKYPLLDAAEAMRYLGTGHARGKVVITVAPGEAA